MKMTVLEFFIEERLPEYRLPCKQQNCRAVCMASQKLKNLIVKGGLVQSAQLVHHSFSDGGRNADG